MNYKPIWLDKIEFDKPKTIDKNIECDVLIVGGGMTGLSTAYHLMNKDLNVCLIDRNIIAHETTARTTGKLTYLQDNIYSKLGSNKKLYYESQIDAINIVLDIIEKNKIDCDLIRCKSYIYSITKKDIKKIKKEEKMLNKLNVTFYRHNKLPNNLPCKYAISVDNTYVFHPIKYLVSLKRIEEKNGINIYENSTLYGIKKINDKYLCKVNNNYIKTKYIVFASHYPYFIFPYLFPVKTYCERSYLSALNVPRIKEFSAISLSKPIRSMRYHSDSKNNYFIYLKGSHNLYHKYNYKNNFDDLCNEIEFKPDYLWSNMDIMTTDSLPLVGFINDNILIATGYNTWGMTNGSLAGLIVSDLILKNDTKYKKLFNPKRFRINHFITYPVYTFYGIKSFIENKIIRNKKWYKDKVIFKKINNDHVAIYIDNKNKEHIVYNKCPHMKCSLLFNELEKTWDCPCHGSRFDIDGNPIFGPSNKNISYKKRVN